MQSLLVFVRIAGCNGTKNELGKMSHKFIESSQCDAAQLNIMQLRAAMRELTKKYIKLLTNVGSLKQETSSSTH